MNSTTQHSVTFIFSPSGRRFCKAFSDVTKPPQAYDNIRTVSAARWEGGWDELVALLSQVPHNTCLIRGDLTPEAWSDVNAGTHILRRLHAKGDDVATLREEAHAWVVLDFDHTDAPFGADAGAAVRAWHDGLPGELRAARSAFYLSASSHQHATVRGHLLVELDRPIGTEEAKALAKRYGADTSVQSPAQPNYFAHPVFNGCTDPLAGRRGPYVFDGAPMAVGVDTTAPKKARKSLGTAHVGELPAPEPTDRVIELAATPGLEAKWLDGGRVETNAWLALCGWLLACGWSRGELVALLFCLDNAETDEAKKAEHLHILGNARAVEAPGAAREWLGDLFGAVDSFLGQPHDPLAKAIAERCAPAEATEPEDDLPVMVTAGTGDACYVRRGHLREYVYCSQKVLGAMLRQQGHGALLRSADGERVVKPSTVADNCPVTETAPVIDLGLEAEALWDGENMRMVFGRRMPKGEAECDADVITWLELLAGKKFATLCEWIAGCHQRHIHLPATALVLTGPGGLGKTLLSLALAEMWQEGATATPLSAVVSKFNSGAGAHPIVIDDEAACLSSGKVRSDDFRELVQATTMWVEPKGRERQQIRGAHRYIVAANDASAIRFKDLGAEGVRAVADRLLRIEIRRETKPAILEALRRMSTDYGRVDIQRIVRTLRWICEQCPVDPGRARFIGMDPEPLGAESAVTAAVIDEQPAVFAALEDALEGGTRFADALYLHGDTLWVQPAKLAIALEPEDRAVTTAVVRSAVGAWRDTSRNRVRWGNGSGKPTRAIALRVDALRQALVG